FEHVTIPLDEKGKRRVDGRRRFYTKGLISDPVELRHNNRTKIAIQPLVRKKHRLGEFAPVPRQLQGSRGEREVRAVGRAQRHITQVQLHVLAYVCPIACRTKRRDTESGAT